jgi:hypothetical protein
MTHKDWDLLLSRIQAQKCTPFLGSDMCAGVLPSSSELALEWCKKYDYWLEDCSDLPHVAQFLAVDRDAVFPKERMAEHIVAARPPNFDDPAEPHRVMAELPLPVYITTNYDDFMVQALSYRHRDPKVDFCRWNKYVLDEPGALNPAGTYSATVANPLAFYVHGHAKVPASLVLAEDDYFQFLINVSKNECLPKPIQKAFANTTLMFVGYRISDWDFRVLLQMLLDYLKIGGMLHVCVQLEPGDRLTDVQKERAQNYFAKYFGEHKILLYWGTCGQFIATLRDKWQAWPGHLPARAARTSV